jgi:hypothetical protein
VPGSDSISASKSSMDGTIRESNRWTRSPLAGPGVRLWTVFGRLRRSGVVSTIRVGASDGVCDRRPRSVNGGSQIAVGSDCCGGQGAAIRWVRDTTLTHRDGW